MPIMRSTSSCEMSVDHRVYNKIVCEEVHLFQPFSSKESGAQTVTKQVLTLIMETNSTGETPGKLVIHIILSVIFKTWKWVALRYLHLGTIHKLHHTNFMIFLPLPVLVTGGDISESHSPGVTSHILQFYT